MVFAFTIRHRTLYIVYWCDALKIIKGLHQQNQQRSILKGSGFMFHSPAQYVTIVCLPNVVLCMRTISQTFADALRDKDRRTAQYCIRQHGVERTRALEWLAISGDIDDELTAKGYIVPGLGDAGDLAYGEKRQF